MTNKKPTTEGSKRNATKGKLVTCVQEYPVSTGDTDSMSIESSPRNPLVTNKRRLTSKSIKPKTNSCDSNAPSDYQVVFGPSSIKSSTDGKWIFPFDCYKYSLSVYSNNIISGPYITLIN
jgi:hypothetical protein